MQEMWAPAVQAGDRPALGSHDWRGLRGGESNQPQRRGEKGGGRGSRMRASAGQSAGAGPSRVTSLPPPPPAPLPLAPRLPAVSRVGGRYRAGLTAHAREGGCKPCSSLSWVPPSPPPSASSSPACCTRSPAFTLRASLQPLRAPHPR